MNWVDVKNYFINWFIKLFIVIAIICFIVGIIKICIDYKNAISSPVENHEIDSIIKENNKLIIEVESLDSIKNAKVIEVKSLDNDSTLRLFYELIRK